MTQSMELSHRILSWIHFWFCQLNAIGTICIPCVLVGVRSALEKPSCGKLGQIGALGIFHWK